MAIPKFTTYGLLPQGIHPCSFLEVERCLSFSAKRKDMIGGELKLVIRSLLHLDVSTLFLGGSFVTEAIAPNDIDCYVLLHAHAKAFSRLVALQENWREHYRVDLQLALTDQEGYGSQAFWEDQFGKTREIPPTEKGILKLILRR